MVSVYEMLECQDMDILPYLAFGPSSSSMHPDLSLSLNPIASSSNAQLHPSTSVLSTSTSGSSQWNREQMQASMRDIDNEKGWCLFSIEVRNAYGLPFDVSFERCQEGVQGMTVSTTVPPGSTSRYVHNLYNLYQRFNLNDVCRIILPLRKFTLPEEVTREPVPTLSLRQFVVTKSKLSKEEEKLQRELFWYREEVFKIVKGLWREVRSSFLRPLKYKSDLDLFSTGGRHTLRRDLTAKTAIQSSDARAYTHGVGERGAVTMDLRWRVRARVPCSERTV